MKKKLLIAALIIAIGTGSLLVYAAANLNSIIATFKPQIEQAATSALNAPVKLGQLEASVFPDTSILVKDVEIGNKKENFQLSNLKLHVSLIPLLSKKLEISKLSLKSPTIKVIKDSEGVKIAGLPKNDENKNNPLPVTASTNNSENKSLPLDINLQSLEVADASIEFLDQTSGKKLLLSNALVKSSIAIENNLLRIQEIHTSAEFNNSSLAANASEITYDLSASKAVIPTLTLNLFGSTINISGDYDTKNSQGKAKLSSNEIDLEKTVDTLGLFLPPAANESNIRGKVKLSIDGALQQNSFTAKGNVDLLNLSAKSAGVQVAELNGVLAIDASNAAQTVSSDSLKLALNGQSLEVGLTAVASPTQINISRFNITGFGGLVSSTASLDPTQKNRFSGNAKVENIRTEQIIKTFVPSLPVILEGKLSKTEGAVEGNATADLMQTVSGQAKYLLTDGAIKGFNIGGRALKSVNNIPFIKGTLYQLVPENKRQFLDAADTEVKSLQGSVQIADSNIYINKTHLESTAYSLDADGKMGFNGSLDVNATISFTPEFSQLMVGSIKELAAILDADKRLTFPLTIKGRSPEIIVIPNISKILEIGGKKVLQDTATKLLDKALKGRGGSLKDLNIDLGF